MNTHLAIKPFVFISLAIIMMLSCAQIGGDEPLPTEAPPLPAAAPTRTAVTLPTFPPLVTPTVGAPVPTATLVVAQNIPGEGDLESRGFIDSGDGKLRVIGNLSMLVTLKSIASPPTAPGGWEFIGPVFDVTAQDRTRKPLQKLAGRVTLRFQAPRGRPVTIMVNDGKNWEIVESEFDSDGNITASVDHFTNYGVGAPQQSKGTPPVTAATPRATLTRTQSAATTRTPQVTVAVATSTVSASTAETALSNAAKVLKGKTVKITSAAGYTGSVSVALPASLQKTLSSVSGSGTVYYGLYNGVNEAITAEAKTTSGTTSGAMTFLVEPKTSMPTTAADAKTKLQSYFPGVTVTLTQAQPTSTGTTGYVFYGTSGNTAYSLGYVSYNGVALAYAMSGSGTYQSLVPKN